MKNVSGVIRRSNSNDFRVLDGSMQVWTGDVYVPFAVEEMECKTVATGSPPLLHIWRHHQALVLGLRDRRLPNATGAMQYFANKGCSVAVRNSGGAAVPLDAGVVNVSLVLPNAPGAANIHTDFAVMANLIGDTVRLLAADSAIHVGEIAGAYCPGDYDLAIDGRKFCGIAQRRKMGGYVLQAFVVVEGSGSRHARTAADFYRRATAGAETEQGLQVMEGSAASLQELLGSNVTVAQFVDALRKVSLAGVHIVDEQSDYTHYSQIDLVNMVHTMKRRYDTD